MHKMLPVVLMLLLPAQISSSEQHGDIKLLDGYKIKDDRAVDAIAWIVYREGGLAINFEAGMNEGLWADPKQKEKYAWYREQDVNGHKVMLALIKRGLKTVWEPDKPRSREVGNILLVTFPLGAQADHTANFKAEILNDAELADALLMILTFNPEK